MLVGVSVSLKYTYDGATSDSAGRYAFKTDEQGEKLLQATSIGYQPVEARLQLSGRPVIQDLQLREEQNELKKGPAWTSRTVSIVPFKNENLNAFD